MAQNILSSGSEELKKAKDMLAEVRGLRTSLEEVRAEKAKADRALQTEERNVTDNINSTIKKRRADLESGFNKEIQKEQNALKKVRNARDKAKSKGIAGRIAEETSELREKNRMLHVANRSMFKQKGLPRFCDTKLFYALYMPSRISDILTCVLLFALLFILLPGAGTLFFDELWQKIAVVAVIWLVVGGLYVLIYSLTKGKDRAVLIDMKDSRKEILKNEKEIRRIKKKIHSDKSEDLYGLESFDDKIRSHEESIRQLTDRKHIVMLDFETNTKKVITEEITAQNADRIRELRDRCAEPAERLTALTRREKELTADLTSNYQAYLGLEYMDINRMQVLIDLIDSGKAETVREAMDVWERQERDMLSGWTENEAAVVTDPETGENSVAGNGAYEPEGGNSEIPDLESPRGEDTEIPDLESSGSGDIVIPD
ncbi:MAG: hypothetical protein LUE29_11675 [Lachnospiraceae bacterium]|nr:hypothetical protein [Lachnospiraceae bacterium]